MTAKKTSVDIGGSLVALVTPFNEGRIDEAALRRLVDWHVEAGTNGIVPCGTTGESATLTHQEHDEVIRIITEQAGDSLYVVAGTGSNATQEAIEMTQSAERLGVTASLQITPYYNKPPQEGLYQHFKAIAEATSLPIFVYNVPGRTSVNLLPETVARLAEIDNIVGIKEACGDVAQVRRVRELCGTDFIILSGEDAQNDEIMELGGRGVISVTANIVPQQMARFCQSMNEGKIEEARAMHQELMPLHKVLFVDTNPIPVKTALAMMGKCGEELRLPLCSLSAESRATLKKSLEGFGLL